MFVERVNREEKRRANCTNRHILKQKDREEKRQNCQSLVYKRVYGWTKMFQAGQNK